MNANLKEDLHMEMASAYDNTNRTRSSAVIRLTKGLYDSPNSPFMMFKTHHPSLVVIVVSPTFTT